MDKCTGCGCECKFRVAKMTPAIANNAPVERLCSVCKDLWEAVVARQFFIEAEREAIMENIALPKHKRALMGEESQQGGFRA